MKAAAPKLAFDNGGAFIQDTRREVEQYLARGSTRIKGAVMLYIKAPIALALTAISYAVLIFVQPGFIGIALCLAGLVAGSTLTAFCVMHDANHGAYFKQRRWNHLVGWSSDLLLGFSSYAWRVKHNVAHHTYTNVEGFDDDATQAPLARFTPSQPARPWYCFQQYYIWPMYTLMGLRWQLVGDLAAFRRGSIGESASWAPRGWNLVGVFAGKAFFIGWALVIPMLVYPWWAVLGIYIGFGMLTGLIMTTFQLAHCVEEASFASADESSVARSGSGPYTRSRPPSTSARATRARPGIPRAASTSRSSTTCSRRCRTRTTPRSRRSCAATAPSTMFATPLIRRSAARCARTSSICGRSAGSACRPRSRWAKALPERDELARVVGGKTPLDDRAHREPDADHGARHYGEKCRVCGVATCRDADE